MDFHTFLPLAAVALDAALGDPHRWPHPVRLIGAALNALERPVRNCPAGLQQIYGTATAFLLSYAACACVYYLGRLPVFGWAVSLYFAYAGLALGQLLREARAAARLIGAGRDDEARRALGMLVSRDTSGLDRAGQWRTLAETVSENFCDAFVAPFLYLCLGGAPLLWLYKTISTMDSMWGYKTQRFKHLGWAGARADDLLAWVPARLSAWVLIFSASLMGLPTAGARANVRADAARMASPNAGWPMSAAAWLCGASMGGRAVYFGQEVEKPLLGPADCAWEAESVKTLLNLIIISSIALCVSASALLLGLEAVFS
nr:CobD/CbiB family cobalamin biosynthesis protein [Fundidesulfovibrio agrisoli]